MTARALAEKLASPDPPLLLDVRTEREWRSGCIDGAVSFPLPQVAQRIETVPADRSLVTYCATGYRSAIATSLIRQHGRLNAVDLVGGFAGWKAAGIVTDRHSTSECSRRRGTKRDTRSNN